MEKWNTKQQQLAQGYSADQQQSWLLNFWTAVSALLFKLKKLLLINVTNSVPHPLMEIKANCLLAITQKMWLLNIQNVKMDRVMKEQGGGHLLSHIPVNSVHRHSITGLCLGYGGWIVHKCSVKESMQIDPKSALKND